MQAFSSGCSGVGLTSLRCKFLIRMMSLVACTGSVVACIWFNYSVIRDLPQTRPTLSLIGDRLLLLGPPGKSKVSDLCIKIKCFKYVI